jgi:hypothetical protein
MPKPRLVSLHPLRFEAALQALLLAKPTRAAAPRKAKRTKRGAGAAKTSRM